MERVETIDMKCDFLLKKVEQLTAINKQLSTCVHSLKQYIKSGAKVFLPTFLCFDSMTYPDLTLSADSKTVRMLEDSDCICHGNWFLSMQSLAEMGNKFTVSLREISGKEEASVGVTLRDASNNFSSKKGSWMLKLLKDSNCSLYSNVGAHTKFTCLSKINDDCSLCVRLDSFNELL